MLTLNELDDWFTNHRFPGVFSDLNDIGDFNYVNNVWIPNAKQWDKVTGDSYMTWGNWGQSASTTNAYFSNWGSFITKVTITLVAEPSSLVLIGMALFGLIFSRRRL